MLSAPFVKSAKSAKRLDTKTVKAIYQKHQGRYVFSIGRAHLGEGGVGGAGGGGGCSRRLD